MYGVVLTPDPITSTGTISLTAELYAQQAVGLLTLGFDNSFGDEILSLNCTQVGISAGANISTGSNNTMFGFSSGKNTTIGNNNTCIGTNAGLTNISGSNMVAIGSGAMQDLGQGNDNICMGSANLRGIFATNKMTMIGNNNMSKQTYAFVPDNLTVIGNNNFDTEADCPEFQHTGAIVIGSRATNDIPLNPGKDNIILVGNDLNINQDMVSNTTLINGTNHALGNFTPKYNIELQGIQALRSKLSTNIQTIPSDNFMNLKNLTWNWSSYASMVVGTPTVVFDINMEDIDWNDPVVQADPNGKSVFFTLEFSFNGTNSTRTALTAFGGSVAFLVLKNGGNWIFTSITPVLDLTANANNRGYYQFTNSSLINITAYQPTLGNPNIKVGLSWSAVVGSPMINSTVSTNVRAILSTNLVNLP
jgi:hypothetical protein